MKRVLTALLALLMCLPLAACRESPVLHEVRYEQSAPEPDENEEMLDPEETGEPDEQFDNEPDDTAETARGEEHDQGLADPEPTEPAAPSALDTAFDPNASGDWQSPDAPGGEAQAAGGEVPDGEPEDPGDSEEAPPEPEASDAPAAKQLTDAAGRLVELPEHAERLSAVGWAAQLTALLGGVDALAAADSDFLASPLAQAAFPGLDAVPCLWYGSGDGCMTDAQFAALLDAAPDVCFEVSGAHTFTAAQVTAMEEAGAIYFVLPQLTGLDALTQAAGLVAEILGTDEARAAAAAYCGWAEQTVSAAKGAADCTSLYIADWDDGASYVLDHTRGVLNAEGSGLAMACSPRRPQFIGGIMRTVGVVNESTRIMSTHRDADYVYVAPMFHQFDAAVSGSRAVYYSGAGEYGSAFDLFVARMVSDTVYYQLGSAAFPAVIAANAEVKAKIESDWFWQYHPSDASGYVAVSGESFYCGVIGEYEIYTVPQGMGSWAEGSLDAPLLARWLGAKFGGAEMETVRAETAAFYREFFGLELSERQLDDIFGGSEETP